MDNTEKTQDKSSRKEASAGDRKITLGEVFRMREKKGVEAEKALREMFQRHTPESKGDAG